MSEKIPGGFIIKARCIEYSKISTCTPCTRETWNWLLENANFSDQKTKGGFLVKRGQIFRRYSEIRDGLSWFVGFRKETYSESQMKASMKKLKNELMITSVKHRQGVMVTICNYDKYQTVSNYEQTTEQTTSNTNDNPTLEPDLSDNKQEGKESKKETTPEKFPEGSDEIRLSKYLFGHMQKNNPDAKEPNYKKWAVDIDYMIRLDKRSIKSIKEIIYWSQRVSKFYFSIILSTKKLREHYDAMLLKKNGSSSQNSTSQSGSHSSQSTENHNAIAAASQAKADVERAKRKKLLEGSEE